MTKFTSIICLIFSINLLSFGQKTILLTKYPKEVPPGKKWVFQTGRETALEVDEGVLNDGSLCYALFLSSPGIARWIAEGDYGRPNSSYAILFKSLNRVAYANDYTFSIVPQSVVTAQFELSDLRKWKPNEVGQKELTFFPGDKVAVTVCLSSLPITEFPLNESDRQIILTRQNKRDAENKKRQEALNYSEKNEFSEFSIPINAESEMGLTALELQDEHLYRIDLTSDSVKHNDQQNQNNESILLDTASMWELTLTNTSFEYFRRLREFMSPQVYSFKVISYVLQPAERVAKFELSANYLDVTHTLYASWIARNKTYLFLLKGLNNSEQFRFVNCKAFMKNGEVVFPRIVGSNDFKELFAIRKKRNKIKACWISEDSRRGNYHAVNKKEKFGIVVADANGFTFVDIDQLGIPSDLMIEIQTSLSDKEDGNYVLSFRIDEARIERAKMQFEQRRKIALSLFYKGTYNSPEKYYVWSD